MEKHQNMYNMSKYDKKKFLDSVKTLESWRINRHARTANHKALLLALQMPYDLFMEQLYRSKEAFFSENQSFNIPKVSYIKVSKIKYSTA